MPRRSQSISPLGNIFAVARMFIPFTTIDLREAEDNARWSVETKKREDAILSQISDLSGTTDH
ncbi:MAG: hypothetical protein NT114_02315 [Patescibacteria group bacterium]|nr:hypothetical protein [Patescibacteria group bacterium]